MSGTKRIWEKWVSLSQASPPEPSEEQKFLAELDKAHQEWRLAQERINQLTTPELIDHAIFVLEAAEKKYSFFLRKAREKGIRINIPYPKVM